MCSQVEILFLDRKLLKKALKDCGRRRKGISEKPERAINAITTATGGLVKQHLWLVRKVLATAVQKRN